MRINGLVKDEEHESPKGSQEDVEDDVEDQYLDC